MVLLVLLLSLLNMLLVLLTVAFFTLFERKVMGLVHLRLGPVKVSFAGILQPLLDAFKLLTKQVITSSRSNKVLYSVGPQFSLILSLILWILLPFESLVFSGSYSLLSFLLLGSLMVLANLISGWASNSKYTLLGSLRSVAQSISYEAVMTTIVLTVIMLGASYSFYGLNQTLSSLIILLLPIWIICILAETHRSPFDFSESESELVSGYNTEYSGALFAFVFLSEYSALLFSSVVIYYLFLCPSFMLLNSTFLYSIGGLSVSVLFILIRVTYCRYRYDFLMMFAWKSLLPIALGTLLLSLCI